ncbi:MAG: BatA and WFA domain-containing protein [Candidatus Coproplasma sp.]
MSFLQPLGFLALLAIPVLIIIYIIKSKYTEQVIPSTYLWELSERFLKRKNPLKAITGILSLILQILAVVFIALAVAHPTFVVKGGATDYCFVLDSSASMNIVEDGKTRFDSARDEIRRVINSSADGSTYTLISAGNTTDVVFHGIDDKKSALNQLSQLSSSYASGGLDTALMNAQNYFNSNTSMQFYLVTDKNIENVDNVNYILVNGGKANYGLTDASYIFNLADDNASATTVTGKVWSYSDDATLTVEVYVDGGSNPVKSELVQVGGNSATEFSVQLPVSEFYSITVRIKEKDDLPEDNAVTLYGASEDESYSVLIISKTPYFIQKALEAANLSCEVLAPEKYSKEVCQGYSLYVFDSDDDSPFTPDVLPSDGAVWFINPSGSVEKSGFSTRGKVEGGGETELSTSSATRVRSLLKGTSSDDTTLASYVKCGQTGLFYNLMFCNNDPVIFAGSNGNGNREVVFAFDWNLSDFPLSYNGRAILNNLINYTFPSLADETLAYSGESVSLNVLPGCKSLKVYSPSGEEQVLDTSETISEYMLTEVGEYTVTAAFADGSVKSAKVFAQFPEAERILNVTETNFVIVGEAGTEKRDGRYEDILYIFIILAVIVLADWAVYCYEQYQLR